MAGWSFAVRRMKHPGKERHGLKYRELRNVGFGRLNKSVFSIVFVFQGFCYDFELHEVRK